MVLFARNSDTLKFFGSGQIIDANRYPDLRLLPNGIFLYNGWDERAYSGDMLPPFKGAWGIWIRKTQYGLATDNNGADVVISENGKVYAKLPKNNDWIKPNDKLLSYESNNSDIKMFCKTSVNGGFFEVDVNTNEKYQLLFQTTQKKILARYFDGEQWNDQVVASWS